MAITTLHPDGQGSSTDWTYSDTSAVADVGSNDGDTSYIYTTTNAHHHAFTMPDTDIGSENMVMAVEVVVVARGTGTGNSLKLSFRRETVYEGGRFSYVPFETQFDLTTSYEEYRVTLANLPFPNPHSRDDGWASDGSNFDDYEVGVYANNLAGGQIRVTELRYDVIYRPEVTLDELLTDEQAEIFEWVEIEGIRWIPTDRGPLKSDDWTLGAYYWGLDYRPVPGSLFTNQMFRSGRINKSTGREEMESASVTLLDVTETVHEHDANTGDPIREIYTQGFYSWLTAYGDRTNIETAYLTDSTSEGYNSVKGLDPKDWGSTNYGRKFTTSGASFPAAGTEDSYVYIDKECVWYGTATPGAADEEKLYSTDPQVSEEFGGDSEGTASCQGMDASGPWLAIGGDNGAVELFYYSEASGRWQWKQRLTDGAGASLYGRTMAISCVQVGSAWEGTLLVGENTYDTPSNDCGRCWVYTVSGYTWSQQGSCLQPASPGAGDRFGYSMTVDHANDECFIAAHSKDGGTYTNQGYIYHWTRSGSTWTEGSNFTPSDVDGNNYYFGTDMQMASGHMIVGTSYPHKAYYFADDSGWIEKQILDKSGTGGYFGSAVALSRPNADYFVVGWQNYNSQRGAAVTYTRSGFVLTERDLIHESTQVDNGGHFGASVSMDSDGNVLAGCPGWDDPTAGCGKAFYYERDGNDWGDVDQHETAALSGDGTSDASFGGTVRLTTDHWLVSEPNNDDKAGNAGCVYDFLSGIVDMGDDSDKYQLLRGRFGSMNSVHEYNRFSSIYPICSDHPINWAGRWVKWWINAIDPLTGYPMPRTTAMARTYTWGSHEQDIGPGRNRFQVKLAPLEHMLKASVPNVQPARVKGLHIVQGSILVSATDNSNHYRDHYTWENIWVENIEDLLWGSGLTNKSIMEVFGDFGDVTGNLDPCDFAGSIAKQGDRLVIALVATGYYLELAVGGDLAPILGFKEEDSGKFLEPDNKASLSDPPLNTEKQEFMTPHSPADVFVSSRHGSRLPGGGAPNEQIYIEDGDGDHWNLTTDTGTIAVISDANSREFFDIKVATIGNDSNGDYIELYGKTPAWWGPYVAGRPTKRGSLKSTDGAKPPMLRLGYTERGLASDIFLKLLTSTGFLASNGAHDQLNQSWGIGFNVNLIDTNSFAEVAAYLKMWRMYAWVEPMEIEKLLTEELKWPTGIMFGQNREGQLQWRMTTIPTTSESAPEILQEHWQKGTTIRQQHRSSEIVNKITAKIDYNPLDDKFFETLTAQEPNSLQRYGERGMETVHHGIRSDADMGGGAPEVWFQGYARLKFLRQAFENPIITGQIGPRGLALLPGDGVFITQDEIQDVWDGTTIGIADRPGEVLRIDKDDVSGKCTVEVVYDGLYRKFGGYAPAAVISSYTGNTATTYSYYCCPSSAGKLDASYFTSGDKVYVYDGNQQDPTWDFATVDSISGNEVTFTGALSNLTPGDGDVIVWADWDNLASQQEDDGYVHISSGGYVDSGSSVEGWTYAP